MIVHKSFILLYIRGLLEMSQNCRESNDEVDLNAAAEGPKEERLSGRY
jgi:hypothetical protein